MPLDVQKPLYLHLSDQATTLLEHIRVDQKLEDYQLGEKENHQRQWELLVGWLYCLYSSNLDKIVQGKSLCAAHCD